MEKTPINKRSRVLNKIAAIMRSRFNELVELEVLNSGKSISAAQGQVMQAIEDFEFYAGAIVGHRGSVNNVPGQFHNYTEKEPVGEVRKSFLELSNDDGSLENCTGHCSGLFCHC